MPRARAARRPRLLGVGARLGLSLALLTLACRGGEGQGSEQSEDDEGPAQDSSAPSKTEAPSAGDDDPFAAGLEHLRPSPQTGWPVENVDIDKYAGWRIDPITGGYERVDGLILEVEPEAFVLAIAPGRVRAVEPAGPERPDQFIVHVDHGQGIESSLGPLGDLLVHAGLPVERGSTLGLAADDELRLRVRVDGVDIDPLLALRRPLHRWPALLRALPPPPSETGEAQAQ